MSNMEHELTCCVCLELYEKPLLLPCSHNFCRKCILGLVQYNSGQGAMRRSFSCPKCRREIYLEGSRMRGVDCLPINQVLDNIVKVYKTQSNISSTRPSKLCSTHSQPQTSYCHTCKKLVCYECIQLTHSGFGHVVKDSADFIDEEKSKIQQSLHELTTFKSEMKVRRQSLEQFIKDAKSHETTMHKTNEDEIQQLVSALVLRKQQLNRAIFTRYQTTIRPAEMLKNKFFYVESEASKLEKEFDHILDEKDDARKIRLLQMFHTRLSSFLTFKAGSIEELPEEVYLPRLQWENLDSVRDTISAIKWSDDSPQGKLQADSGLHKRLAVRSFSLPASEEVDVGRFMRQVYDTSDQHQSSSSLPTCSPSILSAGSSAMSSPALPSSPSHCLAAVPTSSAMLSFKNVFSSVAAKLQCGNPALAGAASLSRGSSPECRSPVPFSPASKSPSLKKKTTMGEHSAHARGDAHAQQNVFNFSFVSSENKACAASQTLNGGSPRMSSASTQTLANNNMPEPEQVDKDNEENEGKSVKKRERRSDVRSVQSEAWQGENPQNVSFQPLKLDFSVRPKVYTKGDASKFKSSAKHSVKSVGNQLEKSLADLHKMWGNFKVGETHDGTDSRDSLRQQSTEPSVSHGFHFTPSDSRKVDQSKTNFNFASSEAEGDTPGPSALFVFGQPAEGENIPRTTATKDSVIRSNGPSSSSQKDAPSGCSNCHPDLSRKEPLPSTSKSAVLSFYFDKKSACDKKSDSNANLNDNGNESMHSPKLKKSMKSLSKSQEKMQNGMNPRMAASLRVGISSSGPRDDARRAEDATFNVKEERELGAEATKVAAESSGLDGQVQGEHAEASSAVFSLGCHPSFSMGKGSSQNKQGSPTNKRTIKKLCRRK